MIVTLLTIAGIFAACIAVGWLETSADRLAQRRRERRNLRKLDAYMNAIPPKAKS